MRTRLIRLGEFADPIAMTLPRRPSLGRYEHWSPERHVGSVVYDRLVERYGVDVVLRQYRGWRRGGQVRRGAIPDFLIVDQPERTGVIVIEIKARTTVYADVLQLAEYATRALETFEGPVVAVLAAPSFSRAVPEWITRWHLEIEQAA